MRSAQDYRKVPKSLIWAVVMYTSILSLRKQKQANLYEFEASLVYRASSRIAKATQRNPVSTPDSHHHHHQKKKHEPKGLMG